MAKEDVNVRQENKITQAIVDRAFSQPPDRGLAINIVNLQFSTIKQDKKTLQVEADEKPEILKIAHKEDISCDEFIQLMLSQNVSWENFQKRMRSMYIMAALKRSGSVPEAARKLKISEIYVRKIKKEAG